MKYKLLIAILGLSLLISACSNNITGGVTMDEDIVVIETNYGDIEVQLNRAAAPTTVGNFENYVQDDFYNGLIFHRVIDDFMIQGGGFTKEGIQKETYPPIKLESNNGLTNDRGTIAMARTIVEDSATSQFFINLKDNDFLNYAPGNPGYTVFGKVISGMDVVDKIAKVQTTNNGPYGDWPVKNVIIKKIYFK